MSDEETEPWTLREITDELKHENVDSDGRVIRELTRRVADAIPTAKRYDAGLIALDLGHALWSIAEVVEHILTDDLGDLEEEERDPEWAILADQIKASANYVKNLRQRF